MEASWDDLKLFLIVAEGGGLSAASARTGISAPTIGRRMLALERTMNRILFERSRRGYELAADGICLLERVREMATISGAITQWHSGAFGDPFVGIAGDSWLAMFLAQRNKALSHGPGDIRFCCFDAHEGLNMSNRDSDIAIISNPPQTGNFAVRPSVHVAYAVYQAQDLGEDADRPWVSLGKEDARFASERWVYERHDLEIYGWTNSPHVLFQMIKAGQGRSVLPCFLGDAAPELIRASDVIEELTVRLHLVVNDDDRHRPEIRTMIERLSRLLEDNRALFAGECRAGLSTGR
ncbi:LysR family transcriptional regulator [Cohaesibacter sp. CAU 1516]|uniref:LysR family transcriptional regulator n=1 Tax=Cohaesibacter sp. CAU 1516 TaxID=2576038 RepID=UPI0010FE3A14|nr:LysR family transcriptional regulator [Cohaesibacter sp. CAU 1516]TLP46972.1 LysR family transcriptional regulator [Cohaesibacter sp. CAU 1516]